MPTLDQYIITRHSAQGNTFLIALSEGDHAFSPAKAGELCEMHSTDGFITMSLGTSQMILFNADGSRAEISGNGLRCLGQALTRYKQLETADYTVYTDAGPRDLYIKDGIQEISSVTTSMSAPQLLGSASIAEEAPGFKRAGFVDVGNPHLVVQLKNEKALTDLDLSHWGRIVNEKAVNNDIGAINVEFVSADPDNSTIHLRVFERGVGVTKACGSGAVAATAQLKNWGEIDALEVKVRMDGGTVMVITQDNYYFLAGPVNFAAQIQ